MRGIIDGLLIWAASSALVKGAAVWMGQSGNAGDAANGIPASQAHPFFCCMVFGVPILVVIGIPILAIIATFSSASKKNVSSAMLAVSDAVKNRRDSQPIAG